ncbi:MAG: CapA family protein, partial [Candidatus Moraniibacteriota bacterium]
MKNDNVKFKIIIFLFLVLFFSGCANNTDKNKKLNNSVMQDLPQKASAPDPKREIKILFVGDMMFDRYIRQAVEKYGKGDYNHIFGQIKDKLSEYDLVVGNLEGPITDKKSVSVGTAMDEKKNLKFTFDPAVAKALVENNI